MTALFWSGVVLIGFPLSHSDIVRRVEDTSGPGKGLGPVGSGLKVLEKLFQHTLGRRAVKMTVAVVIVGIDALL